MIARPNLSGLKDSGKAPDKAENKGKKGKSKTMELEARGDCMFLIPGNK